MNSRTRLMRADLVFAIGALILTCVVSSSAQVQTTSTTTTHPATRRVQVENAEIIYIKGNELILRMSDGSIRHISNVPESARAVVDGQEIGIKDAKVGMKLQRTITTTTTPKVITTVQKVQGEVFHVQPPSSVILTLENGENQQFKIPKDQKFMVNGDEKDVWALRKGMMVSATKIVEEPITVVEQEKRVTGEMPPPPPMLQLPADLPILVAISVPTGGRVTTETHNELPQTASGLPLLGLLGVLFLLAGEGLRRFYRVRS